jgi:hypothetical protein
MESFDERLPGECLCSRAWPTMKSNLDISRRLARPYWSRLLHVAAVIALAGLVGHRARAQQVADQPAQPAAARPMQPAAGQPGQSAIDLDGIEILLTAYAWVPWINVGVDPNNPQLRSGSDTIGPYQLIEHLSWTPFAGEAEFRSGPYGVAADYIHLPVQAGIKTRNVVFGGGAVGFVGDIGTAVFLYRPVAQPDQYLDVGLGVRAWGLAGDLSLNQGLAPALSVSNGVSWADPLLVARYHHELGNGFGATAYADVGGFGAGANIDWQLIGTIDYRVKSWADLHVGFRSLNANYDFQRANVNFHFYGPLVAATFHL